MLQIFLFKNQYTAITGGEKTLRTRKDHSEINLFSITAGHVYIIAENSYGKKLLKIGLRIQDAKTISIMTKDAWNPLMMRHEIAYGSDLILQCRISLLNGVDIDWRFWNVFNYEMFEDTYRVYLGEREFLYGQLEYTNRDRILGQIQESEYVRTQKLEIRNVTKSDQGLYSCIDARSYEEVIDVEVVERIPPRIKSNFEHKPQHKMIKYRNDNLFLECKVERISIRKLLWYKNGRPLAEDYRISKKITEINREIFLNITSLSLDDAGNYSCLAANLFGRDEHFIVIDLRSELRNLLRNFIINFL